MKEQITLDECIKYFEADAAENKKLYLIYKTYDKDMAAMHKEDAERSAMVAAWLKELQKWRSIREKINALCDTDCDYPEYRSSERMCDACPIGTVKVFFEQLFDE